VLIQVYYHPNLSLVIDWDEYRVQMSQGQTNVSIDERWRDDTAVELDEMILLFNDYVEEVGLSQVDWRVIYQPHLDVDEINRLLGFRRAPAPDWAGERVGEPTRIDLLPELQVGIYLVDQ
jgi:hypothetical protein